MAAIITNTFKQQIAQSIFDEVYFPTASNTHKYYIGIGKSEQWDSNETVPNPLNSPREIRNLRAGLQSIKATSDLSFVIPRYNWTSGSIYQGYDDNFTAIPSNSYYVLTEDNQVYICLQQGRSATGIINTSTIKPTKPVTDELAAKPFKTDDGYVWKFLYSIGANRASTYLSANFLPIEKILDSDLLGRPLTILENEQLLIQNAAVPGQILGVAVTNGGTGYTSAPTVTIEGDGVRAAATAFVSGGTVVKIELDSSADSTMTMGQGYNFAGVSFNGGGGTGAAARAILGTDSGIGADVRIDLKSTSLMFNTKPDGIQDSDFLVNQDFRQVALIRDPKVAGGDSDFIGPSGKVLRYLTLQADASVSFKDVVISGLTSGAQAHIDDVDGTKLYFHQSELTGFKSFVEGEVVQGGGVSGTLVASGVDADTNAFDVDDIENLSGDIIYIENRAPVFRSANQTEDIKVVITL
jgi:hypothetical protein